MPRKHIVVYDIFGVFVTVHPISRNPVHQLAIRKKMDKCYFVNIIYFSYSS